MASTRPYKLVYKGTPHIIEAPNAAVAVQHVVNADLTELRPARAAEVTAWIRGGNDVPVAEAKVIVPGAAQTETVSSATGELVKTFDASASDLLSADEAKAWLAGQPGGAARTPFYPLSCWNGMQRQGQMDLEDFDSMRVQVPTFGAAMLGLPNGQASSTADVERLRTRLEEAAMPFDEVVRLISVASLAGTVAVDRDSGEERLVGSTGHLDV